MKELRPLIPVDATPTSGIQTKVVPTPIRSSLPPSPPPLQPGSGKKVVTLTAPGSELNTGLQELPKSSGAAWPFPSKGNAAVVPPVASNAIPKLRPLNSGSSDVPKLAPIVKPAKPGVLTNPPIPSTNTGPSLCAEIPLSAPTPCVLAAPVETVAPAVPQLTRIDKPKAEVVHEIPALAAVIKNDEMFIIFGITPGGEAEYKGMFTKTKLQEYAGGSIGLKACSLLIQIYETQGGNADWVARRNAGHCRAETREITSPNGTGTVAILVVADDGQGRGAAVWDDPETDREARSEVAYTLSIFKTKMNELGISVPLTLLG